MDGTLILTKSGKVHPVDENDWRIGFDTCFKKLKQLNADEFKLVIFTNQKGLSKAMSTDPFRKKIQFIQQKLNVPLQVRRENRRNRFRFILLFRSLSRCILVDIESRALAPGYFYNRK